MARPPEGDEPAAAPLAGGLSVWIGPLVRRAQAVTLVSVLSCGGYYAVSRVVLNLFPFSSFSMYAGGRSHQGESRGCHLLAVGSKGTALEVSEYASWDCPPWEEAAQATAKQLGCDYQPNVEAHIREHLKEAAGASPAAEPVRLVRRLWVFRQGEATVSQDLEVARCRAVPR